MKKIIKHFRALRYRKLYRQLVFAYIENGHAENANYLAHESFTWITGREYSEAFHG